MDEDEFQRRRQFKTLKTNIQIFLALSKEHVIEGMTLPEMKALSLHVHHTTQKINAKIQEWENQ